MEKRAIKDLVYGGMMEIINNRDYYYHSSVGAGYSHLTDSGEKAMTEFLNMVAFKMKEAEEADLNKRSKEMVMNALKGKNLDGSKST